MEFEIRFILMIIPVISILFYSPQVRKSNLLILGLNLYLFSLLAITLLSIGREIYQHYREPFEWDFLGFWIGSNVAAEGGNFYNPENYQKLDLPYPPSDEFRIEIIDIGFWYPPFSMFLFLPLSLFNFDNAYLIWQITQLFLAFGCIYMVWRLGLQEYKFLGFLLIAVLFLRLNPTRTTISFAQTNFLNLLFFLFFLQNKSNALGGIWLALCVVVKPYMAFLYLYPLLTKQWKPLLVAITTLLAISFLSFIVFGADVFFSFFSGSNVSKMPDWIYTEQTNQSLLATIMRLTNNISLTESPPFLNPIYLIISLILTGFTLLTVIKSKNDNWTILSILFLALIIYPANQEFYSVFLIIPIALLIQWTLQNKKHQLIVFLVICIIYLLSSYNFSSKYIFFANIVTWFTCMIWATKFYSTSMKKVNYLQDQTTDKGESI